MTNTVHYKSFFSAATLLAFMVAVLHFVPPACYLFLIAALAVTFNAQRPERNVILLLLATGLTVANAVVLPKGMHWSISVKVLMVFMAVAILMSNATRNLHAPRMVKPFYLLYAYIAVMAVTSLVGWSPLISELKIVLFVVVLLAGVQAVMITANKRFNYESVRNWLLVLACFYMLGSIGSLAFPSVGYSMVVNSMAMHGMEADVSQFEVGTALFNGMTWHSQSLGPLAVIFNAILLSDVLLNARTGIIYWANLGCIPILIFMTRSRTGMVSYMFSIICCFLAMGAVKGISLSRKSKAYFAFAVLVILALVAFVVSPQGRARAAAFLQKTQVENMGTHKGATSEALIAGRMGKVEGMLYNFKKSPLIGNGFQVSSEFRHLKIKSYLQLLSAPVEKGVLPVMLLEEGGIVGAGIFLSFLIALYSMIFKTKCYMFACAYSSFFMTNMGEATMFSPSGQGGFMWMLCFVAMILDFQRNAQLQAMRMFFPVAQRF